MRKLNLNEINSVCGGMGAININGLFEGVAAIFGAGVLAAFGIGIGAGYCYQYFLSS